MKLIDKSAVVAEIKTRIETYNKGYANGDDCRADALETFLHDIDFLAVEITKEELIEWLEENIDKYIYITGEFARSKMFEDFRKATEE